MMIDNNDLYYGAALKQIADHKLFKSINAEWQGGEKSRCAYRINTDIGIYVRAATKPVCGEYVFNFKKTNFEEWKALEKVCKNVFIVLVCYDARAISRGSRMANCRQICVLQRSQIEVLITARGTDLASLSQINVLITVPDSQSMRAAVAIPGTRGKRMELKRKIPRNAFPKVIFS
jgi:hypothetical protein